MRRELRHRRGDEARCPGPPVFPPPTTERIPAVPPGCTGKLVPLFDGVPTPGNVWTGFAVDDRSGEYVVDHGGVPARTRCPWHGAREAAERLQAQMFAEIRTRRIP